jgi:hypothetical protein
VILLLALVPSVGFAQSKKEREEAGLHFTKGIEFYKEGNYGAALAEFNAAYKAVASHEVLFNIGLSQRRLFKYGDAVKTLNRYLADGGAKVPKDRREAVKKELDAIRALVAEVTIKVEGPPAVVELDGEKLGKSPLLEPLLVGPGKHTFRAEREGEEPDEKTMELVSVTKVEVSLKPKVKVSLPGDLAIESSPARAIIKLDGKMMGTAPVKAHLKEGGHEVIAELDGYVTARTEVVITAGQSRKVTIELEPNARAARKLKFPVAGVIIAAVGAVTIGGGAGLSLSAQSASRSVSSLFASGGEWNDSYAAIEASGKNAQTWSTVLMVTGAVIVAAGVVVAVISLLSGGGGDSSSEEESPASEESSFFIAPSGSGATVGWSTRW